MCVMCMLYYTESYTKVIESCKIKVKLVERQISCF